MLFRFVCTLVVFLCWSAPCTARADVYRYVNDAGMTFYVTSLEAVPPQYRSQLVDTKPLPPISRHDAVAMTGGARAALPPIEIFVASWCPYCQRLEAYLRSRKLPFKRYDIESDTRAQAEYRRLGGGGIPIVRIGTEVIRGFDQAAIEAIVGRPEGQR